MIRVRNKVSSVSLEFERNSSFHCKNSKSQPSVSCFHRVELSLICVPCVKVIPSFLKCNVSKEEPESKSDHCKGVLWRDPKRVDHEESSEEVD
jgi:hypothetical protein